MTGAALPLGILAGGGDAPLRIARHVTATGRPVVVVLIEGWADPADWAEFSHVVERLGAAGRILGWLREQGARDLVLSGRGQRPSIGALRPDALGARLLARIGRAYFQGDDGLLRAVTRVLEAEGFAITPPQDVMRELLPPEGLLAGPEPDALATADITRGIAAARALGAADIGQAVVVQQGLVLGVEAIEGTDALLARCAGLRREGPGGVLVKLVKPGQDRRVDLPTIGPATVAGAAAAGLRGIAIEAGGTLLVDRAATLAAAEAARIFILNLDPDRYAAITTEETPS